MGLQAQPFALEEVDQLGASIPTGSPFELGIITAITEMADSSIWVLDPLWPKIVGFDPSGAPTTVVPLTKGKGPGEVTNPIDLAAIGDRLAVLDHGLGRVTIFSQTGEVIETVRLESGAGWRFAFTEDRIWTTKPGLPSGSNVTTVVYEHDRQGELLRRRTTRDPQDLRYGTGLALTRAETAVLTAAKNPGAFWVHDLDKSTRRGANLFPELEPRRTDDGVLVMPIQIPSMAVLPNGAVAQHWVQVADETGIFTDLSEIRHGFSLLTRAGELIATARLRTVRALSTKYSFISSRTGHLYVPENEMIPQLVKYRWLRSEDVR
jgi:hypothetical protein